ncbi:hypothetical protein [Leptospira santarosai]|nr:hypothetical protein [Leptospira santarosai]
MEKLQAIIKRDGELHLTGLPFKKGESVEILMESSHRSLTEPRMTVKKLRESGMIGLWKNRSDITDSVVYSRELRTTSEARKTE